MLNKDIVVIGIAGGSGSGKTTLTEALVKIFGSDLCVVRHDDYYKAHDELTYEERSKINYDHPDSFDTDLLIEHLELLKKGIGIECPTYDYVIHNRAKETRTVIPKKVILVEGILIFENPRLYNLFDIKIFVDTDSDVRILRRLVRDVAERGRSIESVVDQYLTTVKPMHEKYVEPSKKNADIIVLEGGHNEVAKDLIVSKIRSLLKN